MNCLLGDLDIVTLYSELANKNFSYQAILKETELLTNLYYHQIRDGSQALRIPTENCSKSKLEQQKLYNKMESLINLFVSNAKKAAEKTASDILIIGVVEAITKNIKKNNESKELELAETTIYLADFGVDAIAIYARNWQDLKQSIIIIQAQASQPLAPFLSLKDLSVKNLKEYLNFYENLQLELLGFEIEPTDLNFLNQNPIFFNRIAETNSGFLLKNWQSQQDLKILLTLLKNYPPTAIFAGANTPRNWWNSFAQGYFG